MVALWNDTVQLHVWMLWHLYRACRITDYLPCMPFMVYITYTVVQSASGMWMAKLKLGRRRNIRR